MCAASAAPSKRTRLELGPGRPVRGAVGGLAITGLIYLGGDASLRRIPIRSAGCQRGDPRSEPGMFLRLSEESAAEFEYIRCLGGLPPPARTRESSSR